MDSNRVLYFTSPKEKKKRKRDGDGEQTTTINKRKKTRRTGMWRISGSSVPIGRREEVR